MSPAAVAPGDSTEQPTDQARAGDYGNPERVLAFVKERVQADVKKNTSRQARDRADLQALQFYRGGEDNHWTVWDPNAQTYVPRPVGSRDESALPEWFFRATTNHFANKIDGITAILNQSRPAQEVGPARDDDECRAAADTSEDALPVLHEEVQYEALRPQINKLVALTNGVAVHVYYDDDEKHGVDELQLAWCSACHEFAMPHEVEDGAPCEKCGEGTMELAYHPTGPQAGQAITQSFPKGKTCARLLSSFEFSIPRSARDIHEERVAWIAGHGRMDPNEILRTWAAAKGKVDPETKTRGGKAATSESSNYADQLQGLAAPTDGSSQLTGTKTNTSPAGPVVWMVWADPVDDGVYSFPEGLYAAILDDETVLEAGPLPFTDEKGRPFKNVLLRTYQATAANAWGKPPSDDMVPLQKQLNLAQALAFLILMNEAAPTTWVPDTVTLLDELTNMPGQTVRYSSLRAGDKPVTTQGSGFPEALRWFIEFIIAQFDVVSHLNSVLQGERPEGDPTLGEVQILDERGMRAFGEPLGQLVDFEKRLSLMLLRVARQSMWAPRFYTVKGDNGEWQVQQFLGADLDAEVTIHVEPASAWPSSQVLQNLRLDQAFERGILNPQDPEVQDTYLSTNNLAAFKKSTDAVRQQIARHLDAWKQAETPEEIEPPDPLWNLPVHFFHKVTWLWSEEAELLRANNAAVYAAIRQHVMTIQLLMMPAAPAPQPGQDGTPPDGQAVDAAVDGGALRPKAAPNGQALEGLVSSGALRPAGSAAAGQAMSQLTGQGGPSLAQLLAERAQGHGQEAVQ